MKTLFKLIYNLAVCAVMCVAVGINPLFAAAGVAVTSVAVHYPAGAFFAGVYQEVWTGEQIKAFRTDVASLGWLAAIPSYDQYVRPGIGNENDVIHLVAIGADPKVLINNTTYPIATTKLEDGDVAISLDKYQTEATPVTDDEIHAITYDKMASVIERHRDAVNETKYAKAIHALAPSKHQDKKTPILLTTGANSADGTRKMITRKDIISMKKQFDEMRVPTRGRILVLCNDHVADLLENDQKFADQYYNYTSGKISNLMGFEIYEYTENPYFSVSTKTKVPYGAVPGAGDRRASIAYYAPRMFKATGTTTTYPTEAEATMQQNLYNVRHYFITLPKTEEAIGAIVSGLAA